MARANSILEMFDLLWVKVILDRHIVRFGSVDAIRNALPALQLHCVHCKLQSPPEDHQIVLFSWLRRSFHPNELRLVYEEANLVVDPSFPAKLVA